MKNACILLRNINDSVSSSAFVSVTDCFLRLGYAFEEIRCVSDRDGLAFEKASKELIGVYDNVLLLAGSPLLGNVAKFLETTFAFDYRQKDELGNGIFGNGEKTVLLLSVSNLLQTQIFIEKVCTPYLDEKFGTFDRVVLRSIGANEATVANLVKKAEAQGNGVASVHWSRKYDEDVVEVKYGGNAPKRLIDGIVRDLADGLSDGLYAVDDTSIEERLVQTLQVRDKKISVAESFTGGGVAKRISSVSGASSVYFEGLNTYNELSKQKRLGVSEYTLGMYGAVSDKTAFEMASGLMDTNVCDISIATTGIAGPNSDRTGTPVGTSFIAIGTKEKVYVYQYLFKGTRKDICEKAINYALFLAYKHLKNE